MERRFDEAVATRDSATAVRFAKLYKPLGKQVGCMYCISKHVNTPLHTSFTCFALILLVQLVVLPRLCLRGRKRLVFKPP